jgi:hypothetical protein
MPDTACDAIRLTRAAIPDESLFTRIERMTSATSRDFPKPASATMPTTWLLPSAAKSNLLFDEFQLVHTSHHRQGVVRLLQTDGALLAFARHREHGQRLRFALHRQRRTRLEREVLRTAL